MSMHHNMTAKKEVKTQKKKEPNKKPTPPSKIISVRDGVTVRYT